MSEDTDLKKKTKLFFKLISKIAIVTCTGLSFFQLIFISDFHFDIGQNIDEALKDAQIALDEGSS
eukprot:CAMPEP_0170494954 /NCGR_PEP_ID=MMETSP0208-20121228/14936_1 /TAXON_ID=197538 /ORGANISM="Strombidium inclinatum, Strain S3" /LENGTH=64 /DNA_ID=CAMNT_0010771081 /DNA_START=304 /DNA_END=498 /DNA_ORIENTATION=+